MNFKVVLFVLSILVYSCNSSVDHNTKIITSDIDLFWKTFDLISSTTDSTEQARLLTENYINKGTLGLQAMMEAKRYTVGDYIYCINTFPQFWKSIRENTYKSASLGNELNLGINKFKKIYPKMKEAEIYFTIGAMRSNGTTMDDKVLIGSEFAMADNNTNTEEFTERMSGLKTFFASNPIDDLILLNIHEYVHTQQNPIGETLLNQCLFEGIAEFVSSLAMEVPSAAPAIEFGKKNETALKEKFEKDMFLNDKTYQWIWGDEDNGFGVRDLGYYIGYEIAERYYNAADNKSKAIEILINIDYSNSVEVLEIVDGSNFFSKPIDSLRQEFMENKPKVIGINPEINNKNEVNPNLKSIQVNFSEPMDIQFRNFDYGPMGENNSIQISKVIGFSDDKKSIILEIAPLEKNKIYQLVIGQGFRDLEGYTIDPYLIEFKTKE